MAGEQGGFELFRFVGAGVDLRPLGELEANLFEVIGMLLDDAPSWGPDCEPHEIISSSCIGSACKPGGRRPAPRKEPDVSAATLVAARLPPGGPGAGVLAA